MTYDTMSTCAAMIFATAVEDMAAESNRPIESIRKEVLESKAYECLLNFDSGLWMLGPDYFRDYFKKVSGLTMSSSV
ncbi:MAG: hypothetical protein J5824_04035 [Lachnospiraceae bacterium]|nr:hypothetical protein [Lachnospiraceae bacterium]